jgi:hypothetical protein
MKISLSFKSAPMYRRLFSVLLGLVAFLYANGQSNLNISNYAFSDSEPGIISDPSNSNHLTAAWMKVTAVNQISVATSYSSDGGITWSTPTIIPHLWTGSTHADVGYAYTTSGTVYLTYIDYSLTTDTGYVMITKSVNGGQTWSAPNKVMSYTEGTDTHIDRPWVAVDNSGGTYNGWIYVVSKSMIAAPLPHRIWIKSSPDGGATWTAPKQIDDSIPTGQVTNAMGSVTVASDGAVYVGYVSYSTSLSPYARMICTKSTNGGGHFTPYVVGLFAANSAVTDTLYQGSYVLSTNPLNSAKLIYTYTDARDGDPDIMSFHSSDHGVTWSAAPLRVNDDAIANGKGQDMCWAAYAPNGTYGVAWRDRRNGTNNDLSNYEIFCSISLDDGASFSSNHNMSTAPSPYVNMKKGNDFLGITLTNSDMQTDWCDARSGNNEIFTQKTALSSIAGIQELQLNTLGLKCFPNPNTGNLNITFTLNHASRLTMSIFSVDGKYRKSLPDAEGKAGENTISLNTTTFPAGQYFLHINGKGQSGTVQFQQVGN